MRKQILHEMERLKRFESDKILRIKEGIYIKKGH